MVGLGWLYGRWLEGFWGLRLEDSIERWSWRWLVLVWSGEVEFEVAYMLIAI
jgi:hypothetical protein